MGNTRKENTTAARYPVNNYSDYHAHVYFDENSLSLAKALCLATAKNYGIPMGHMHQRPVGPHPVWSCQLSFNHEQFPEVIEFLDINRNQLTVLVHGVTGDDLADHTEHAYWLGEPQELDLRMFQ